MAKKERTQFIHLLDRTDEDWKAAMKAMIKGFGWTQADMARICDIHYGHLRATISAKDRRFPRHVKSAIVIHELHQQIEHERNQQKNGHSNSEDKSSDTTTDNH